jgi:multidrug resistance efflux pump
MKTPTNREIVERSEYFSQKALDRANKALDKANAALAVAIATPIGLFVGFVASLVIWR